MSDGFIFMLRQLHALIGSMLAAHDDENEPAVMPVAPKVVQKPAVKDVHSKFKFSQRSLRNFEGVDPRLIQVTTRALELTPVDFVVIEGVRTAQRQKKLFEEGHTQTLNSRHLTGHAVDLVAWIDGDVNWKVEEAYFDIADAMIQAADELGVKLRWGAAWSVNDLRKYADTKTPAHSANHDYKFLRRSQGRTPFIDMVHFELPAS